MCVGEFAGVEDFLDGGAAGEVGLVRLTGPDAVEEALPVVGGRVAMAGLPLNGFDIRTETDLDAGLGLVEIDPQSYLIQDGQLMLFYNGLLADTRALWMKRDVKDLARSADRNWGRIAGTLDD